MNTKSSNFWKKIPLWAKIIFPVAFLLVFFFALRGGGRGALKWLSTSPEPSAPLPPSITPGITPEVAEDQREEVAEETATEKERIKEKYDAERERADKWLRGE